jgi:hypothetical protein
MIISPRLAAVILILLGGWVSEGSSGVTAHDGVWWRGVGHYRHLGFMEGYLDCNGYVNPGPARFVEASPFEPYTYEKMIGAYYDGHPKELRKPAAEVFLMLAPAPDRTVIAKKSLGTIDGEDWRQGGPSYRLGFIEGYFECLKTCGKSVAQFSKPESYYVEKISNWYGVKDDGPGAINLKRSATVVARVLFTFKDPSSRPPTHAKTP